MATNFFLAKWLKFWQEITLMKFFRSTIIISAFAFATSFASSLVMAKDYEMEDIMKKGMKGDTSLLAKVQGGTATDEEKKTLLAMFVSLAAFTPEKGDQDSWKTKTTALKDAMQPFVDGKGDVAALKKASNCKACHSVHKQ